MDGRIAGYRTFLRWEFEDGHGQVHRAVRAVDTATHPDFQGRGVFRTLTLAAVEAMTAEGVDFVFNTPNDKSRPGYLKMGWHEVGRLPAAVAVRGPFAALRLLRARTAAERTPLPGGGGAPAPAVLDDPRLDRLLFRPLFVISRNLHFGYILQETACDLQLLGCRRSTQHAPIEPSQSLIEIRISAIAQQSHRDAIRQFLHPGIIHEKQGLRRDGRTGSTFHNRTAVGSVEQRCKVGRLRAGSSRHQVQRSTWRGEFEKTRSLHFSIQFTRDGEHRVANFLRI